MSEFIPLPVWWQRADDETVAFEQHAPINVADFKAKVTDWVELLASQSGDRWAVHHTNAVEFLAILCALWQLSRTACIPGDSLPATTKRMAPDVDGFVGEFDTPNTMRLPEESSREPTHPAAVDHQRLDWQAVPATHIALEVYTSGSTGQPKVIQKHVSDLIEEHAALGALLPERSSTVVIATVTHHHLYGMTFRLFRPFSYGQAFTAETCEYLEEVLAQAQHHPSFSLISSPSHLGRFNQALDWVAVKDRCVDVYSSAAHLKRADSLCVSQQLDAPVVEIYGSTETGAIAWRRQVQNDAGSDAFWQPLSHVRLIPLEDQTLQVAYQGGQATEVLADQVTFDDNGSFALHGRLDQIAKVEGKRLSLLELETVLQQSDWVAEAKAVILKRKREEVAAVVRLSKVGIDALLVSGRKPFIKQLKSTLSHHFETVLLPRRWRFVDQLPYNSQGKLTQRDLVGLFMVEKTEWPEVVSTEQQDDALVFHCLLPTKLRYFEGHFDEQGVLPGIVQVHWAARYGQQHFQYKNRFSHLEAVKFQRVLFPEQAFQLTLRYDADKQKLQFKYESQQGVHSSGRICYA